MEQSHQTKEMSGNKMAKLIIGTIIVASIIIVIAIQVFYMLWEPKKPAQNKERQDETEQPSYSKSAMLHYDQLLRLG